MSGAAGAPFIATLGELVDAARAIVHVSDIFREHDIEVGPRTRACCPWHDDRRPSLDINDERGLWICRVCNVGGDQVTAYERLDGLSRSEAMRALVERAGLGDRLGRRASTPAQRREAERKREQYKTLSEIRADVAQVRDTLRRAFTAECRELRFLNSVIRIYEHSENDARKAQLIHSACDIERDLGDIDRAVTRLDRMTIDEHAWRYAGWQRRRR